MQDTLGKEIKVGDTLAICKTKGSNTTLVIGEAILVRHDSTTYTVVHPGPHFGYGNKLNLGDTKIVQQPHRVLIIGD